MKNKVSLLIDSSVITHQALYSTGHLSYSGRQTGVVFGFLKTILALAKRFNTNKIIYCWDSKDSHRRIAYSDYKKKRREKKKKRTAEEKEKYKSLLKQQTELREKILPALGFRNSFLKKGFEADDILAWWAAKLKRKSIIVTTDADMYQCLDNCDIFNPRERKIFNKKSFLSKFGVSPSNWALAKAIGGCSGDGVEGIRGVSDPKSASSGALKYIQGKLSKGAVLKKIESEKGQEIIKRNLPLVTVPFDHNDNRLERMIIRKNKFGRKKLLTVFDQLHFVSFLDEKNFINWKEVFLQK